MASMTPFLKINLLLDCLSFGMEGARNLDVVCKKMYRAESEGKIDWDKIVNQILS